MGSLKRSKPAWGAGGPATSHRAANGTPTLHRAARDQATASNRRIVDSLREELAGRGVDAIVTRPLELVRMTIDIARSIDRLDAAEWNALTLDLGVLEMKHQAAIDQVNEICRKMMNARKRGELPTARQRAGKRGRR